MSNSHPSTSNVRLLKSVVLREWHRMTSRRLYFGVCLVLPLFTLFFMATIFGNGQMENIPVGIVDQDNTATSREIVRRISAVPTFKVTHHFANEADARRAVQQKEIYGYLSIPPLFEQDALTGKDATLCYYYHYALLSVGGELMAAFESSLAPVALSPIAMQAVALGTSEQKIETFLLPVQGNNHPIYNPSLDYSVYLSQPFFFVLFQVLILLITVYTVGSEIKFGTSAQWMETAGGNIVVAVVGKLLPYTLIFCLIGILGNYVMFGILHIPFQGSWLLLNTMTVLFIIATESLGLFIFSLFPAIAIIISIVSMVGSLGATLSGVTFPVANMYPLVRDASYLFPVRHFTEIVQTMLYSGGGFVHLWYSAVILCIFPLLALALFPRLRKCLLPQTSGDGKKGIDYHVLNEEMGPAAYNGKTAANSRKTAADSGILSVALRTFHSISTSYAILLVLIGGIFVYGLLYNYMYAPNIVTDAPVAVVDNSHSSLSRQYVRWLDATPQVKIYARAMDFHEAKEWMKQGKVQGILYLPGDFETRVFQGREAIYSLYATTDAFLYFEALQEATSRVMLGINDAYRADGAVFLPPQGLLAVAMAKPINVVGTALYNYTEGYGSYLIPAVMMIIIFQTLLMVIGMVTGEEKIGSPVRQSISSVRQNTSSIHLRASSVWKDAARMVTGQTVVYCGLYAVFSFFLLGLLPHFFSIPNIGNGMYIVMLMIPYLLATSFFGLAASRYFTDSEAPLLMIAFFSVGLIFLSGVSYPMELMPWYWKMAHYLLPAPPATLAFVKLNSMGASMADIRTEYITLCIQTVVWFAVSVWVYRQKIGRSLRLRD